MKAYLPEETDALILVKDQDMNDPEIQTIINAFRDGATSVAGLNTATGLSLIRAGLIKTRLIKDGFVLTTSCSHHQPSGFQKILNPSRTTHACLFFKNIIQPVNAKGDVNVTS